MYIATYTKVTQPAVSITGLSSFSIQYKISSIQCKSCLQYSYNLIYGIGWIQTNTWYIIQHDYGKVIIVLIMNLNYETDAEHSPNILALCVMLKM